MPADRTADVASGAPPEVRARLALALDVDDLVEALRLVRLLRPWFGVAKVGLELYSAAGPDAIGAVAAEGLDVFADLKFLDIPTTVEKASRVVGTLGARYLTVHTRAGVEHLAAGVEGMAAGAAAVGLPEPTVLGVTVLTSEGADPTALADRLGVAVAAGAGGVVCAASDLAEATRLAPGLVRVVPGIRPAGADAHDQARPATPAAALAGGADLLVIGRAVTRAVDPVAAAVAVAAEVG
ncbi:orotidine-5'-phosphate decarboxylase [Rhabdothermincola salaria]|uniref:orotidine-5'-phosphate decarboxylase n=1 Tax=Rhabdothermincola salaria TaxID=2903142 RepID=UPI001E343E59|nr:orotidine-5'-phosphate decarboxylase [Rhabdothermincola salaria]MCD9623192.1 orotidine-5'-phosphate decarboxylase [Rhabdothermincola salaria]